MFILPQSHSFQKLKVVLPQELPIRQTHQAVLATLPPPLLRPVSKTEMCLRRLCRADNFHPTTSTAELLRGSYACPRNASQDSGDLSDYLVFIGVTVYDITGARF
jgi:hypothetical protein